MRREVGVRVGIGVGIGVGVGLGVALGIGGGVAGCKRHRAPAAEEVGAGAASGPRCVETKAFAVDARGIEFGEATARAESVAVGLAYDKDGARRAGLVVAERAGEGIARVRFEDAGELAPDAPAPEVLELGGRPVPAFFHAKDASHAARYLAAGGIELPWHGDEGSFGYDAALGPASAGWLVAWDETAPGTARGEIRLAAFTPVVKSAIPPPIVASPPASDAESPRVAARANGGWLAWIARAPETEDGASGARPPGSARDGGAAPAPEGPGESRAHAWVEVVALDARGAPAGAVRRLSGASRVAAFDVDARDDALDVLLLDEEEARDGAGARLVLVTLRGDSEDARVVVADGVGHGIPDLIGPWIAFTDAHDKPRIVPRPAPGASKDAPAASTPEPALEGGRPLAALGNAILAGFPADPARAVRVLTCAGAAGKQ